MSDSYIFRKSRKNGYTVIPNSLITDTRLSWEARGLLIYLLSRPKNWTVRKTDLERQSQANDFVVSRILKELEESRYIYREREHDEETGKFEWINYVVDSTITQTTNEGKPGDIVSKKNLQSNTTKATKKDVLDFIVDFTEKPSGLEGYPPDVVPLLEAFIAMFKRDPSAAEKSFWIKTARQWKEMGVKPEDIRPMYQACRDSDLAVKSPASITFAFDELRNQSDNDPYKNVKVVR